MHASTINYIENAAHDLVAARGVDREALGVVEATLVPELCAALVESAEQLLRTLRGGLESFDKILDTMTALQTQCAALRGSDVYTLALVGWVKDVRRMFAAELAHKKLVLAVLGERAADNDAIELHVRQWTLQPMINAALLDQIESAIY